MSLLDAHIPQLVASQSEFAAAAEKVNALLDIAQANLGEAAGTYLAADAAAASSYTGI